MLSTDFFNGLLGDTLRAIRSRGCAENWLRACILGALALSSHALRAGWPALFAVAAASALPGPGPGPGPAPGRGVDDAAATVFAQSLDRFRRGEDSERTALFTAATALLESRPDALRIAEFYASLSADERRTGAQLEAQFDALRERVAALDDEGEEREPERHLLRRELARSAESARRAADPAPAAYALSLLARLDVRELEHAQALPENEASSGTRSRATARASEAIARFERAGMLTPQLEAHWVLARLALQCAQLSVAERHFERMADVAERVGRSLWRERALLGLVGIARERGDPYSAGELLREWATFRPPDSSWSLVREVTVQLMGDDETERALDWLAAHEPTSHDPELEHLADLERARDEWWQLATVGEMRLGRPVLAGHSNAARTPGSTPALIHLTQAAIALDTGDVRSALSLLERDSPEADSSVFGPLDLAERDVLYGRCLLALGRPVDAIVALERAAAAARGGGPDEERAPTASRAGEWLGLSAIEWLARAHCAAGQPLRAAAWIESVYAGTTPEATERRLTAVAAGTGLGLVTWIVGADQSLAIFVGPGGSAASLAIPHGRRAIATAVERARAQIDGGRAEDLATLRAISGELLPAGLVQRLVDLLDRPDGARGGAPTLLLLPHGPLERLPFEALPVDARPASALGLLTALTVGDRLRTEADSVPPEFDGRATPWRALGAPVDTEWAELPAAARELRDLGRTHPRIEVDAGASFSRSALERAARADRALHLSTHVVTVELHGDARGRTGPRSARRTGLLVSGGDVVTADEVAALQPCLPLVFLAACDSGDGLVFDGRGVAGLGQAWLDGGTGVCIVTMRPIDDRIARQASTLIHAALLDGRSPAEGARRARVALRASGAPKREWSAYRVLARP